MCLCVSSEFVTKMSQGDFEESCTFMLLYFVLRISWVDDDTLEVAMLGAAKPMAAALKKNAAELNVLALLVVLIKCTCH